MTSDTWAETLVNIDGEFVPGSEATVSVLDRSFVYGDGIFEGIGVKRDRIILLQEHIDRLYNSAKRTGIQIGISREEMRERIVRTANQNDMSDGYLRPLVSRGSGPLGIHNTSEIEGPTIVVIPQLDRAPRFERLEQSSLRISSITQSSPDTLDPRIKSNNYLPNIMAVNEISGTDADSALLLDRDGNLTEAAAGNIFVLDDQDLCTPPSRTILLGTTRNAVLEVAEDTDLRASIETLTPYDLITADEAFLTGSLSGISPVTRVNGTKIADGEVGQWTEQLSSTLRDYLIETGTPVR